MAQKVRFLTCSASNHWQEYFWRFVPPGAIDDGYDLERGVSVLSAGCILRITNCAWAGMAMGMTHRR